MSFTETMPADKVWAHLFSFSVNVVSALGFFGRKTSNKLIVLVLVAEAYLWAAEAGGFGFY